MPQKSLRAVGIRCWSASEFWSGLREGPGEKRRSDDARARGVGGGGATRCRAKALGWTGSALDHGGVAGFEVPCTDATHRFAHQHSGSSEGYKAQEPPCVFWADIGQPFSHVKIQVA